MYALSKKPRPQSGFTLTEIAIVLGIIGLVISAIWVAAKQVSSGRNTQKAITQTLQILNNYRSLYAAHGIDTACANPYGNFCDVTCTGIINNYFPPDMITTGTTCASVTSTPSTYPQTPWGVASTVEVLTQQTKNTILIFYSNLPQAACIGLASALSNTPSLTYQAIYNSQSWVNQYLPPYGTGTPWTISQITGYCGGTTNSLQIGFTAR